MLLLQETDALAYEPNYDVGGEAIAKSAVVLTKSDVQTPIQRILDASMTSKRGGKSPNPETQ